MCDLNVGVLGAGVVGITTALELQAEFKNAKIEIIADKFNSETTSDVAAGLFRPGTSFSGPNDEITRKWICDAFNHWDDLRKTDEASRAGVTQVSGYIFSSKFPGLVRNHYIEKLVPLYRSATEEELQLCPGNWKYGSFYTTVLTECGLYLPWATEKFMENGGKITNQNIDNFNKLAGQYDIIVNCTGLGAKSLCNDHKLVPMRGQVIKVEASWIKTFFYADYDTYVIPGFNGVTLGGCRQFDSYDLEFNRYDALSIQERCESLLPSLKSAKILRHKVGLRPHRDPVRVEKEVLNFNYGKVKIVHNYGHGGFGVTTAPGTALYAVKLVKESLSGNSKL